jgi:hypothetical protein
MSTTPPPEPPPRPPAPVDLEERGIDPAWVGVGLGAASLGLQALQTFRRPGGQQPPPPPVDPPAPPPQIELPPGVDGD